MSITPNFRIRYGLGMSILLCVLGPVLLVMGVLTDNVMTIIIGVMDTGIGIAMILNPYLVISGREAGLRNMLGMTMRRAIVADAQGNPTGFSVEKDGALIRWQDPEGKARPIKISRFVSRNEDYDAFAAWVRTGVFG